MHFSVYWRKRYKNLGDEFKEVFKNEIDKKKIFVKDVTIETDSEMLIPNYYVSLPQNDFHCTTRWML
jgi:hypothetical protein